MNLELKWALLVSVSMHEITGSTDRKCVTMADTCRCGACVAGDHGPGAVLRRGRQQQASSAHQAECVLRGPRVRQQCTRAQGSCPHVPAIFAPRKRFLWHQDKPSKDTGWPFAYADTALCADGGLAKNHLSIS